MNKKTSGHAQKITGLIADLTDDDLVDLIARFKLEQEERDQKKKKAAEDKIKEIARAAGLTVTLDDADRAEKRKTGTKPGTKARIKYENKATGQTWGGRGLKPRWIKDLIAEGKDLKDYLTDSFRIDLEEANNQQAQNK
jgi:DNA-binding protein H-NS